MIDTILTSLLSYLLLYKYITLFLVVYSTSLMIPLPANTLLIAAGAFASQGYFSLSITFIVALLANSLGDTSAYMLTNTWKHRFVKKNYLEKILYLRSIENYLKQHTRMAIFVTRFIGIPGAAVEHL
jgi:membrane protein DedA with SNARE-associated domain